MFTDGRMMLCTKKCFYNYSIVIPMFFPQVWHLTTISPSSSFRIIFLFKCFCLIILSASRESQCGHRTGGRFLRVILFCFVSVTILNLRISFSFRGTLWVKKSVFGIHIKCRAFNLISIACLDTLNCSASGAIMSFVLSLKR